MENHVPWDSDRFEQSYPKPPEQPAFQTGKKELVCALMTLLCALALCNFTVYGGFNLGFAMGSVACALCAFGYLLSAGCKPTVYSCSLLLVSLVIGAGFGRTDDIFVKFVSFCFMLVGINLSLCLTAGQNLWDPGSVGSLLDVPGTVLMLGIGKLPESFRGLRQAFRRSGSVGQKGGAFLLGVCLCVPLLALMIPMLISADAAFDGLMALLPDFELEELLTTVIFGTLLFCLHYTRSVALRHSQKRQKSPGKGRGINAITVNTVLSAVSLLYGVYLLSQLAYLSGGFAGILPEGYTLAEYARRGFFEMACLSGVNLTVMVLALGLVRREHSAPMSTKLLCLFLGLVTLFLVGTASAKMFLYIGTYGLTRLRVLTQIIMLFMAVTTVIVSVWLFVPKLPYMKAVLLSALIIGAATLWADVDTQVARYNVDAYLSGKLQTVDISHLASLGDGAIPQLARLAREATDKTVARDAALRMKSAYSPDIEDFRDWNYVNYEAAQCISQEAGENDTAQ